MRPTAILFAALCPAALALLGSCRASTTSTAPALRTEPVGRDSTGRTVTPVNQVLTPHGLQIELPGVRPQAIALSKDGTRIFTSGKTAELLVLSTDTGDVLQRVPLPGDDQGVESAGESSSNELSPDKSGQLSYTGLEVTADGRTIYLSNVRGSVKVFAVAVDGTVTPIHSISLPAANAPRRDAEIPTGLAVTSTGDRLYVCGNLSNTLLEIDPSNGGVVRRFDVGVAPFDVALVGDLAFVSNLGGRRPGPNDLVGPAGQGTLVRVDPVRHIASEGSVSVLDLRSGNLVTETLTGLGACALAVSPDQRFVVCANAGSDHLTLLDAATGERRDTIWVKPKPSALLGATPNALVFSPDGSRLFVANGTQNAVAVLDFEPQERGQTKLLGLVPVGWFPGALAFDALGDRLVVGNIKGLHAGKPRDDNASPEFNTHLYHGSVSIFPKPSPDALPELSAQVDANLRGPAITHALLPPRPGQPTRVIPERIGEPSVIRHVVYVIKENRTYDQVLGDMPEGNGDASLCIFGETITPNQHALAREFALLDNTYCSGILSADGHNWSTSAFGSNYMERSFAGWPRSYPDGMLEHDKDALAYSPAGFLWDRAIAQGVSLRNYGEFCQPRVRYRDAANTNEPDFAACWRTWQGETNEVVFGCEPVVPSLVPYSPANYVGWNMEVPDQYRADVILEELAQYEARGEFPQLTIICLPNDHTSGTKAGSPTPAACMADGDLAFGRIVEGLSHSSFWPHMAILGIEDDPQAGWDHVSGYRTTAFVVSPYAKRGVTNSTQYNTTSVLRTIEQVLGLRPMNQFDASATPMTDCFTNVPDYTPFTAQAAQVPLDQMNPSAAAIDDPQLRADALASATIDFTGVDRAPEGMLNEILWRAMRGTRDPYPAWAITPGADDDDD